MLEIAPFRADSAVLRILREKHGMSQRTLAEKSGISRGRLRSLESGGFERATFRELRKITEIIGIELREIFQAGDPSFEAPCICKQGRTMFELDAKTLGYKITAFAPPAPDLFTGRLCVFPKKKMSGVHAPHAKKIFIQIILGRLSIDLGKEKYELSEGDTLFFPGDSAYEIENPLLRDSIAFLITTPAFKT